MSDDRNKDRPNPMYAPACPEPFWIGFRLRIARCECGRRFKRESRREARRAKGADRAGTAKERYQQHWYDHHEVHEWGRTSVERQLPAPPGEHQ